MDRHEASVNARGNVKLPLRVKLGFGIGDLGGNLFFTAMGFYSLFYLTDVVGISSALAGAAILLGKFWDAVTDPMMGFVSDRTRSRWGRRRPYFLFGALPLLLSMWFFFSAPDFSGAQTTGFIWATFALCLLNTAYTVVNIPYGSLTPDLTKDFKERTALNGFRFSFAVVGTILGAAVVLPIVGLATDPHQGFSIVGLLFGVVMAGTILTTFFTVHESAPDQTALPKGKFFATFAAVFRNGTYMRLAAVYTLNLTGITFVQTMLVYYFKYIYRDEAMTTIAMLLLLGVAMICVPVSVLVAKRLGKKRTYQLALAILTVSCLAMFFFAHTLGMTFTFVVMVFAGVGIGFGYVPPFAMLPDVVEVDAVTTRNRKEGAYYGMWTFFSKIGVALAAALAGAFLGLASFVPNVVEQTASALFTIRLLIGPVPAVIFLSGIVLIQRYPLDEKTYDAIVAQENAPADAVEIRG
ncbi:MAG: MFS transporter [Clostridiales bacterium]|nr:MFS transporter [Clostridiales bacterium]